MKCPVCTSTDLVMSERSGIEIDYCPQCRGVWLDRGELDKIIERSTPAEAPRQSPREQPAYKHDHQWGNADHHQGYRHQDTHERPYHGKKSFWQEIFD